ncbi:MAG: exodeoxyribonuclease III [Rubripirellula sp.]
MRLVSWNVNGIRASMDKGFKDFVQSSLPDVLCLQETKATPEQVNLDWADELGYHRVWNCAEKKGYSGTSIWTLNQTPKHKLGMQVADHDKEGRIITADLDDFQIVTVYTPNSQRGLKRLDYRQEWDRDFLKFLKKLDRRKPVIFCGDLNCAHTEIDLANPKSNKKNAGFTEQEREGLSRIFDDGFVDSFRELNPDPGHYSWWTYRSDARARNIGWRLDYFCVSQKIWSTVSEAKILSDIFGSDHCPVELTLS